VAESTLRLGDVNADNKVDSTDARLVLQYAVNKIGKESLQEGAADVDGSGVIDSTDARLILQYAVGKIQEFPAAKRGVTRRETICNARTGAAAGLADGCDRQRVPHQR
jgi:hypothetical protein